MKIALYSYNLAQREVDKLAEELDDYLWADTIVGIEPDQRMSASSQGFTIVKLPDDISAKALYAKYVLEPLGARLDD